jgi:hypothetical protein
MLNLGPISQIPVAQGTLVALLPHIRFLQRNVAKWGWDRGQYQRRVPNQIKFLNFGKNITTIFVKLGEISPYVWSGNFPTTFGLWVKAEHFNNVVP